MLHYNDIKPKKYIVVSNAPYEVLESLVFRKQKRKPVNQTKLKNLHTGKIIEKSFHQSDIAEEANIQSKHATFLFTKPFRKNEKREFWFCEKGNPSKRFSLSENVVGAHSFLKENTDVVMLTFNEEIIGVKIPVKMVLKVVQAPPGIRGNTAQGGAKPATLETGVVVNVPLFINAGDSIIVNTETGEYAGRSNSST